MRGLAEFVMKDSRYAAATVLLIGLIPLVNMLSPVLVGLSIMRRGLAGTFFLIAWALIPLLGWSLYGDVIPLILLFGVGAAAWVLRASDSWQFTLTVAILVGFFVEMFLRVQPESMEVLYQQLDQVMMQSDLGTGADALRQEMRYLMPSLIGTVYAFLTAFLVMFSRWMQASLYNSGGFGREFRSFRISSTFATLLVAGSFFSNFGLLPTGWLVYFCLPLFFAGAGLAHGVVELKSLPRVWLIGFYVILMLPISAQLVVLFALCDSWLDFRGRIARAN
jgi:hypothetical protein